MKISFYWDKLFLMIKTNALITHNLEYINNLPNWGQELATKYCSKTVNLYFVHGNIRDFLPHRLNEGEFLFMKIRDYISDAVFGNRDIIVYYDTSGGVTFCMQDMGVAYLETMHKTHPNIPIEDFVSRDPMISFPYLEQYFVLNMGRNQRMVLIIDYAETIVPSGDMSSLDERDRFCLVTLNRWSHEPAFTREDISVVMLTENLTDINPRLARSPSTVRVSIPFPDETVRASYLNYLYREQKELLLARGLTVPIMASLTSGLNLFNLQQLAYEAFQAETPITREYVHTKKREIIEHEAGGFIEFLDTEHNLSFVAGHEFVKKRLKIAASAITHGHTDVLPMGYLISGPIGTGKSFMVSAFAGEIGIPMVRLRNVSSSVEAALEKTLNILKAMSPVAVMIDEADAVLGNRTMHNASGGARFFAQITSFMGNTAYRGKIIWFLITSRPDLLPVDLKRQGRAEEHLALFYPTTEAEKIALFETLTRKLRLKTREISYRHIIRKIKFNVSGADIEAILVRAKMNAGIDKRTMITEADLHETINDFISPSYPYEIELQTLAAVLECTGKEMMPKEFQNMDRSALLKDIMELKLLLGETSPK